MKLIRVALLMVVLGSICHGETMKAKTDPFYVYVNRGSQLNHYIPSGWMGDFSDLKMQTGYVIDASDRTNTCLKITYSAERKQGAGWAGIYWQMPGNNWGDKKGGYDLSGFKQLSFRVRGDKGKEYIDKFMMGGITGSTQDGDSDNVETQPIELKDTWETIKIDLKGLDLTHIIGGFGFVVNADMNEKGLAFYLDDIQFTK